MVRVSAIITTHNRADLLPRAVQSVLAQTFADYEIIIVDDGSTDHTQESVATLSHPKVRSLRHEVSRGQSAAINTGIDRARGEYVAFLDDDDEWLPSKLAMQVAALDAADENVALAYGWYDYVDDRNGDVRRGPRRLISGDVYVELLALNMPTPTSTYLVRTHVARELRFDTDLSMANDLDFFTRLSRRWRIAAVPEVVMLMHEHHGDRSFDATDSLDRQVAHLQEHSRRYADDLNSRPAALSRVSRHLAVAEMRRGNSRIALGHFQKAFVLDPIGTLRVTLLRADIVAGLARHTFRNILRWRRG